MKSKRSLEGYLSVDNRHAPVAPMSVGGKTFAGSSGVLERSTLTCSHCQRQMIVQPLRTRERPYCRKCDHYICDNCAVLAKLNGGECQPLNATLDRLQETLLRAQGT